MTPETYVIGAIVVLAVILVGILYASSPFADPLRCPRCGAEMQIVGEGCGWCLTMVIHGVPEHVVPEVVRLRCLQCGYLLQIPNNLRLGKSSLKE